MLQDAAAANDAYNRDFADYYDKITKHKDYRSEIDALVRLLQRTVKHPRPRILDVGCGTGNHAVLLAEQGYDVSAIDLSPDMIRIASLKNANVKFKTENIQELPDSGFQFAYSLFNVINCLDTLQQLERFFAAIADRLTPDGVLLVESWNPIAVIAEPPQVVERIFEYEHEKIVRKVVPTSDFLHQRLDLTYQIEVLDPRKQNEKIKSFSVVHKLVLFTPLEIEFCLGRAGFKRVAMLTALPELAPAKTNDRMLAFVCEKA